MEIKDIKMSIDLTAELIRKSLTDLETILEAEGLGISDVEIDLTKLDMPRLDENANKESVVIVNRVNIEVKF